MKIKILTQKPYDVFVQRNILKETGKYILNYIPACTAAVITDDNVDALYSDTVINSLKEAGFATCKYTFKNGEDSKNMDTLTDILNFLANNSLTRSDIIIALGGGVTGDIAGFAASIYLRGIKFVQIPTTFLAAIDSSVGGKTGVNLVAGKNLTGAFWQPSLVLCDCETFNTLPHEVFIDGVAEAIKYGLILDKNIIDNLESTEFNIEQVAAACISIKADIVARDEFDRGERQLLNFGHTIGHAVEKCSSYKISHGHAVAIGMVIITRATQALGLTVDCLPKIKNILEQFSLPTECEFTVDELCNAILSDKKRNGKSITLVILKDIGKSILHSVLIDELPSLIELGLGVN